MLSRYGYNVAFYYYDWRKSPLVNAANFRTFLHSNLAKNEKVHVVAHSMGGLIARAYIELEKEHNRIATLVTVGTPHKGTVLAYPAWSGGDVWGDITWKLAGKLTLHYCKKTQPQLSDRQIIQTFLPSTQSLLPTFHYLLKIPNLMPVDVQSMYAKNNWLPTDFTAPFYGTNIITFSGTGYKTLESLQVRAAQKHDNNSGDWLDGRPIHKRYSTAGDGTILNSSSSLEDAASYLLNGNHGDIISSNQAVHEIAEKLLNSEIQYEQQSSPTIQSALLVTTDSAVIQTDPAADYVWKDKDAIIFFNPKYGKFPVRIEAKKSPAKIQVTHLTNTAERIESTKEINIQNKGSAHGILDISSPSLITVSAP